MSFNSIYDASGNRVPYDHTGGNVRMSGRWPRRDGDTFGIVARQPATPQPSPEPEVSANDPTGHLRPSPVGGD